MGILYRGFLGGEYSELFSMAGLQFDINLSLSCGRMFRADFSGVVGALQAPALHTHVHVAAGSQVCN